MIPPERHLASTALKGRLRPDRSEASPTALPRLLDWTRPYRSLMGERMNTYLFSGYARLPQDVSHQSVRRRVGVVVEVDEQGKILHSSCTLIMDLARDFLDRLLIGHSVLTERDDIEAIIRDRYRGHSQAALVAAMRQVFEAVDQSPLAAHGAPAAGRDTA